MVVDGPGVVNGPGVGWEDDPADVEMEDAVQQHPDGNIANEVPSAPSADSNVPRQVRAVTVEEVPDIEEGGLPRKAWVEDFPTAAGTPLSTSETSFERIHKAKKATDSLWAPFNDEDEWHLAHWLVTSGLTQSDVEKFLKLNIVSPR